jgi:hypothetical protein
MKQKQITAIEWMIGRFHYEGFIGTYCSEDLIKSKRELMIQIIDEAKRMEKEQIIDAQENGFTDGCRYTTGFEQTLWHDGEQYYNETFKNVEL